MPIHINSMRATCALSFSIQEKHTTLLVLLALCAVLKVQADLTETCSTETNYCGAVEPIRYGCAFCDSCCCGCQAGEYIDTDFIVGYCKKLCKLCPAGKSTVKNGQASTGESFDHKWVEKKTMIFEEDDPCLACGAGWYSSIGTACSPCPAGTAASGSTNSQCTPCTAGKYSEAQAAECNTCRAGTDSGTGASTCTPCAGNRANPTRGALCALCSAGKYRASATECLSCLTRQISAQGAVACTTCPAGHYAINTNTACRGCAAGKYAFAPTSESDCVLCPRGKYSDWMGRTVCQDCPAGTETTQTGSSFSLDCVDCANGYINLNPGGTCLACSSNSVWESGADPCYCKGGFEAITSLTGPTRPQCRACGPDQAAPGGVDSTCVSCEPGRVPSADASECVLCKENYFEEQILDAEGSLIGSGVCTLCAGNFASLQIAGSTGCSEDRCAFGYEFSEGMCVKIFQTAGICRMTFDPSQLNAPGKCPGAYCYVDRPQDIYQHNCGFIYDEGYAGNWYFPLVEDHTYQNSVYQREQCTQHYKCGSIFNGTDWAFGPFFQHSAGAIIQVDECQHGYYCKVQQAPSSSTDLIFEPFCVQTSQNEVSHGHDTSDHTARGGSDAEIYQDCYHQCKCETVISDHDGMRIQTCSGCPAYAFGDFDSVGLEAPSFCLGGACCRDGYHDSGCVGVGEQAAAYTALHPRRDTHTCMPRAYGNLCARKVPSCPPGHGFREEQCEVCGVGWYKEFGTEYCKQCREGHTTLTQASHESYSNENETFCKSCPVGKFLYKGYDDTENTKPNYRCEDCDLEAALYQDEEAQDTCKLCEDGHELYQALPEDCGTISGLCIKCRMCQFPRFGGNGAINSCEMCTPGHVAILTASQQIECALCAFPQFANNTSNQCEDCSIDTFTDDGGQDKCCEYNQKYNTQTQICEDVDCTCDPVDPSTLPFPLLDDNPHTCSSVAAYVHRYNEEGDITNPTCAGCDMDFAVSEYESGLGVRCEQCPTGTIRRLEDTECSAPTCSQHKYWDQTSRQCVECGPHQIQHASGAFHGCSPCPSPTAYRHAGMLACAELCEASSYYKLTDALAYNCEECEPGKFLQGGDQVNYNCVDCSPGTYSVSGVTQCLQCVNGKYQSDPGQSSCDICADGMTSMPGSTQVTDCKACSNSLQYFNLESSQCEYCPWGKVRDLLVATTGTSCRSCSQNDDATQNRSWYAINLMDCVPCPANTFADDMTQDYHYVHLKDVPSDHPHYPQLTAGTPYRDTQNFCQICPDGVTSSGAGEEACEILQNLQPLEAKIIAWPVDDTVYPSVELVCSPGAQRNTAGECEACPADHFKTTYANVACDQCDFTEYYADRELYGCGGSDPGWYVCKPNLIGVNVRLGDSVPPPCTPCPQNHERPELSLSAAQCTPCADDFYRIPGIHETCVECESAKYRTSHEVLCQFCPAGKYGSQVSAGCTDCEPGKFQMNTGAFLCNACDSVTSLNRYGQRPCNPGHFYAGCGGGSIGLCTVCPECTAGKYRLSECGPWTNLPSCEDCSECPAGYQHADDNDCQSACVPCPLGFFKETRGTQQCLDCISKRFYPRADCLPPDYPPGLIYRACGGAHYGSCLSACSLHSYVLNYTSCVSCVYSDCEAGEELVGCGGHDAGLCQQCPPNHFSINPDLNGCQTMTKCEDGFQLVGHLHPFRDGVCEACGPGKFRPASQPYQKCIECPSNEVPNKHRSSCVSCDIFGGSSLHADACMCTPGHEWSRDDDQCVPCATGKYWADFSSGCQSCEFSETTLGQGSVNVDACVCAPGYEREASFCVGCGPGLYTSHPDQTCQHCAAGSYPNKIYAADSCIPCPANSYCPSGSIAPQSCPANSNSPAQSSHASACVCDALYFLQDGVCILSSDFCPVDHYYDSLMDNCTPCPPTFRTFSAYASGVVPKNSDQQCACPHGHGVSGDACTLCSAGKYQDAVGKTSCLDCPQTTTSLPGSHNIAECFTPSPQNNEAKLTLSMTRPLVLCVDLAAANDVLIDIKNYYPNYLQETQCVALDVCDSSLRGEWKHLSDVIETTTLLTTPPTYYDYYSIEFARIPTGITLSTCSPDFDYLRRNPGAYRCNAHTLMAFTGTCREEENEHENVNPHDCVTAVQSNRIANGDLYDAAPHGSTQMFMVELLSNYTCDDLVTPTGKNKTEFFKQPHFLADCEYIDGATFLHECEFDCNAGYTKNDATCVWECGAATEIASCGTYQSTTVCAAHPTLRECHDCQPIDGSKNIPSSAGVCQYESCAAGQFSPAEASTCLDCAQHTYSNNPGQASCTACDILTGQYQPLTGQQSCLGCILDANYACPSGFYAAHDFAHAHAYFIQHSTLQQYSQLQKWCTDGFVCLPCPPGEYGDASECFPCPADTFQENYGTTVCFDCLPGTTTDQSTGANSHTQCICSAGYESPA